MFRGLARWCGLCYMLVGWLVGAISRLVVFGSGEFV